MAYMFFVFSSGGVIVVYMFFFRVQLSQCDSGVNVFVHNSGCLMVV